MLCFDLILAIWTMEYRRSLIKLESINLQKKKKKLVELLMSHSSIQKLLFTDDYLIIPISKSVLLF